MQTYCECTITGIGSGALDFADDRMLILFSNQAGNGLEEYSVQISTPQFQRDIKPGDTMYFGDNSYLVTAVGEKAMETFRLLGHCTLRFDGSDVAVLPGTIHVESSQLPPVIAGTKIIFC